MAKKNGEKFSNFISTRKKMSTELDDTDPGWEELVIFALAFPHQTLILNVYVEYSPY